MTNQFLFESRVGPLSMSYHEKRHKKQEQHDNDVFEELEEGIENRPEAGEKKNEDIIMRDSEKEAFPEGKPVEKEKEVACSKGKPIEEKEEVVKKAFIIRPIRI